MVCRRFILAYFQLFSVIFSYFQLFLLLLAILGMASPAHAQGVKCLEGNGLVRFLRNATLVGVSVSSRKTWKAYFPRGGRVLYRYHDGTTNTAEWRVSGNKVCLSFDGRKYTCRHVCRYKKSLLWIDQKTRKLSSVIAKRLDGNQTGSVASVVPRFNDTSRQATSTPKKETSRPRGGLKAEKSNQSGPGWGDLEKMDEMPKKK